MKSRFVPALAVLGLFAFLSAGCHTLYNLGRPKAPSDADSSFLYGYVHSVNGAPGMIRFWPEGQGYIAFFHPLPEAWVYSDGLFFLENAHPGKWSLYDLIYGNDMYMMMADDWKSSFFDVKPGQVRYVGAWEIGKVTRNFFSSDKFEIQKVVKPGPVEMLTRILAEKDMQGSEWVPRIQAEIKRLRAMGYR
jgi:hypothetical protein